MNLKQAVLAFVALAVGIVALKEGCGCYEHCSYNFPSFNPDFPPPPGTPEAAVFHLSQDYPKTFALVSGAWQSIDFKRDPQEYAHAVLSYCVEGNVDVDFRVQENTIRKWYHTPWLHFGETGREWRHGLTKERVSKAGELHPKEQTDKQYTWAVGFYNEPGGYTIGKVWPNCGDNNPDPTQATFPEGTVAFKLLFTSASTDQVPYLKGSLEWLINSSENDSSVRGDKPYHLLQVDIAVKDSDSPIGWVFGTFIYDGLASGATVFDRLKLVGLTWGVDPGNASLKDQDGAFVNPSLQETVLNADVLGDADHPVEAARVYHVGLGGRLDGPIDNPVSSCTSCHGTAAILKNPEPDPINEIGKRPKYVPKTDGNGNITDPSFNDFFHKNSPPGAGDIEFNCFMAGVTTCDNNVVFVRTDYSLQIAAGIENYYTALVGRAQAFLNEQAANSPR